MIILSGDLRAKIGLFGSDMPFKYAYFDTHLSYNMVL
jgi:hypothetical protein